MISAKHSRSVGRSFLFFVLVLCSISVFSASVEARIVASLALIETQEYHDSELLAEELTPDKFLEHLPLLLRNIGTRPHDDLYDYPPLPDELGIKTDVKRIPSSVIAKIITVAICKLRDNTKREKALSILEPFILDAMEGRVESICFAPVANGLPHRS